MEVFVLVESKPSIVRQALAWLFLCLAVICMMLGLMASFNFVTFAIVFIGLWYYLFFKGDLEYEYSYFDGDVRFAKVINKSRRKNLKAYSVDDVIQIAPAGDRSVYKYENDSQVVVKDYTSHKKDVPYYDMIIKDAEKIILYKVELDDKYLDAVSIKYSQKVIRR